MFAYQDSAPIGNRLKITWIICLLIMIGSVLEAEPRIKQYFPSGNVLLGQPVYWIIEVRHPLWESYTLNPNSCTGAEIHVVDNVFSEENGEICSRYRLKVVPVSLVVSDTPSVLISDQKGQSTVLTGKPFLVSSISGASLEIKDPGVPRFSRPISSRESRFVIVLGLLFFFILTLVWMQFRARSPRHILLRGLRTAREEIRKQRFPASLIKLLRSELLWGFSADACTASQLLERCRANRQLQKIAGGLDFLEQARYSGKPDLLQPETAADAISAAIEIVRNPQENQR